MNAIIIRRLPIVILIFSYQLCATTIGSLSSATVEPFTSFSSGEHLITGFAWMKNGFELGDKEASVIFDAVNPVSGTILLNGGALILNQDLVLRNPTYLENLGTIFGNSNILHICSSIEAIAGPATLQDLHIKFDGDISVIGDGFDVIDIKGFCNIQGQGNTINMHSGGMAVEQGSTLSLTNLIIKGIGNNSNNITLSSPDSELELSNVTIELMSDIVTKMGTVRVKGPVRIITHGYTWTFENTGTLLVDGTQLYCDCGEQAHGNILFDSPQKNIQVKNGGVIEFSRDYIKNDDLDKHISHDCYKDLLDRVDRLQDTISYLRNSDNNFLISDEFLFDISLLPNSGAAAVFQFEARRPGTTPRVIFDPDFFGNDGRVELPALSRITFRGDGIVQIKDGVVFDFASSQLIFEDGALLQADPGATVVFGGQAQKSRDRIVRESSVMADYGFGQLIIRKGAQVLLDNPTHVIFGETPLSDLSLQVDCGGMFVVNNKDAVVSFHLGTFDITFSNHSILDIVDGTVELNMLAGQSSPGVIKKLSFTHGAMLEIHRTNNAHGILSLAPNSNIAENRLPSIATEFDTTTGTIKGDGTIQFKNFDASGCVTHDTLVCVQKQKIHTIGTMTHLFMALSNVRKSTEFAGAAIVAQQAMDGKEQYVVFCPECDGSVVLLKPGDHDVFYDGSYPDGPRDVIRGYDQHNKLFEIKDGQRR